MRIFLTGFMASGKTTLGKVLASELNMEFVDLDEVIMTRTGKTVKYLFATIGEEGFRIAERESLLETLQKDNIVIATGGGAPCYFDNLEYMLNSGMVFYLKLPPESLVDRMLDSKVERPLIWGKNKEELTDYVTKTLSNREAFYNQAHYIIDAKNLTIEELVTIIKKGN